MKPGICILTETYYPVIGGGETQARILAEGLVERGFDVLVLTRRSGHDLEKQETYRAVTVYRLPPAGPQHYKKWGLLLSSIPALLRFRSRYDVILVSGFRVIGLAAVMVSALTGTPCVLKADSLGEMSGEFFSAGLSRLRLDAVQFIFRWFIRLRNRALQRASRFVAISSVIEDELTSAGAASHAIRSIPNSVDTTVFCPASGANKAQLRGELGLPAQGRIAVYTGRLVSYKGLPLLLRVWSDIVRDHPDACLLLVGSGGLDIHNCEAQLKAYVRQQQLEGSVLFAGAVRNVADYLRAADLFVFPSENEAFGISVIEAMACGLPVITTAAGGLRDLVQPHENGLVVPAGEHQPLYDALDTLLRQPTLAARLGDAARRTAEAHYSTASVIDRYVSLLAELGQG